MKFSELIKRRRSIRTFTDQKLSPSEVEEIMKAALLSPSSKNKMPWEFVLVEDREQLNKLSKCKKNGARPLDTCTLAIVILANPIASNVWIEDASIASLMMQLQIEDLGLGSCWIQIRDRETIEGQNSEEYVRLLLDIPMHLQVLDILAVGHKVADVASKDEDNLKWEKIHIDKYTLNDNSEL